MVIFAKNKQKYRKKCFIKIIVTDSCNGDFKKKLKKY